MIKTIWSYLQRVPAALWVALATALGILLLILRGRHLEAELAAAKLREQSALASAHAAQSQGKREVYELKAGQAAAEVKELEQIATAVQATNREKIKKINGLSDAELDREYAELAKRAKERAKQP